MLIVGTIAFDTVTTATTKRRKSLGGSAVYAGLAASHFTRASLLSAVGGDFTQTHGRVFAGRFIDTKGIIHQYGEKTMRWMARYSANGEKRVTEFLDLGAVKSFAPKLSAANGREKTILLCNLDPKIQQGVLRQASTRQLVGLDTMDYWIANQCKELLRVARQADIFFLNESEARQFTGSHNIPEAVARILKSMRGRNDTVVIKRGSKGAVMFQGRRSLHLPAVVVPRPTDPTGAGDSFAGAFMGALESAGLADWTALCRAARLANATASFCVQSFGPAGLLRLTPEKITSRAGT